MSSIDKIVASKLKKLNKTLSIAESCTGGSICSRIVYSNGASTYFKGGVVCYSTDSKINILGLDAETINNYSVVAILFMWFFIILYFFISNPNKSCVPLIALNFILMILW